MAIQPSWFRTSTPFVSLYREAFNQPSSSVQIDEADALKSLEAFFLCSKHHDDWYKRLDGTQLGNYWNGMTEYAQHAWRSEMRRPWVIVADGMEGGVTSRRAFKLNKLFWLIESAGIAVTLIVACETKWVDSLPDVVIRRKSWVRVRLGTTPE